MCSSRDVLPAVDRRKSASVFRWEFTEVHGDLLKHAWHGESSDSRKIFLLRSVILVKLFLFVPCLKIRRLRYSAWIVGFHSGILFLQPYLKPCTFSCSTPLCRVHSLTLLQSPTVSPVLNRFPTFNMNDLLSLRNDSISSVRHDRP